MKKHSIQERGAAIALLAFIGVVLGIAWPPLFGLALIGYLVYVATT